jgi:hypothetical protein
VTIPSQVKLVEVGPTRRTSESKKVQVPTSTKVELINKLADAGTDCD